MDGRIDEDTDKKELIITAEAQRMQRKKA